jgi:hypothetical protein
VRNVLASATLRRLAYDGSDGFPRVIPIGSYWNGNQIVVCTAATALKVKALSSRPNVAMTIDVGDTVKGAVAPRPATHVGRCSYSSRAPAAPPLHPFGRMRRHPPRAIVVAKAVPRMSASVTVVSVAPLVDRRQRDRWRRIRVVRPRVCAHEQAVQGHDQRR